MAPKHKITKEMIIQTALEIVRESGMETLNARALAKKMNCSTQPIFSNYASMMELQNDVVHLADTMYQEYIQKGMQDSTYPPYKASGRAYIRFALEEKELFRLLFMRDRTHEEIEDEKESLKPLLQLISESTGLSSDDAYFFHIEMWLYVHGIATTIATSFLEWDWDLIDHMMADMYEGMKLRYARKDEGA